MQPIAILPLKGFDIAKERLAPLLDPERRAALASAAATRVVHACRGGGFSVTVVTGDPVVRGWATALDANVVSDPGQGLDQACAAGMATTTGGWLIVHGDLPLLDAATMDRACRTLTSGRSVIAPSRDGGTNLLGTTGSIRLSYGPGSFHRHLGAIPTDCEIFTGVATLIELDTPEDLEAAHAFPGGAWLGSYLP